MRTREIGICLQVGTLVIGIMQQEQLAHQIQLLATRLDLNIKVF